MTNYPISAFHFKVRLTGVSDESDASFQEASGISMEQNTNEAVEGGENQFNYKLPQANKYSNLVLKRGLIKNDSQIAQWCQQVLSGGLNQPAMTKSITLDLLNPEGKTLQSWEFINAYPVKWSVSDLKSREGLLVLETLEFAYNYFQQS